jgi:TetR/AcrR family transcriptional regulator, mexCD-oprJ operon repressor
MSRPEPTPTPLRPAPRQALQQRVSAAILEAAAHVLAGRGEQASMNDVALAAGVARATVYRYFPNRQSLLEALAELAVRDAAERLASARIDEVSAEEGIRRAVRALVDVGDHFVVLARERIRPDGEQFERGIAAPLRHLFERGASSGEIRKDIPSSWLTSSLVGPFARALPTTPALGKEDKVAAIAGLFLDGVRSEPETR